MDIRVNLFKEPKLRNPDLISGLPGIGYIAKLSVDYLIQQLKAELIGEIQSRFFPPYVLVKKGGIVELLKNELYCWRNKKLDKDLLFFTGAAQALSPEGQYMIADEVLNTVQKLGVKRLYSLAAYMSDRQIDTPRVYGVSTNQQLSEELKSNGVLPMENGNIAGTNGLILGLARARNIQGICLLGETRGYRTPSGRPVVDAEASKAVLEVLIKILKVPVDMLPIEEQAKQTSEFIERIEEIERRMIEQISRTPPIDRYIT